MMYFVITTSEDGEPSLRAITKPELLKEITPDADGYSELRIKDIHTGLPMGFVDLQEKAGTFIIKGDLVVPFEKKVVTTFDID